MFKALNLELNYTPPTRGQLLKELLYKYYQEVKDQLEQIILAKRPHRTYRYRLYLNFITDESGINNRDRVSNLSLNTTNRQAFFVDVINRGGAIIGSNQTKEVLIEKVSDLIGNKLLKWNSIYTDTCSTQRNFYRALQADVRTKHMFYMLYDEHRL